MSRLGSGDGTARPEALHILAERDWRRVFDVALWNRAWRHAPTLSQPARGQKSALRTFVIPLLALQWGATFACAERQLASGIPAGDRPKRAFLATNRLTRTPGAHIPPAPVRGSRRRSPAIEQMAHGVASHANLGLSHRGGGRRDGRREQGSNDFARRITVQTNSEVEIVDGRGSDCGPPQQEAGKQRCCLLRGATRQHGRCSLERRAPPDSPDSARRE